MKRILFLLFFIAMTVPELSAQESFSVYFDSNKHDMNPAQLKPLEDWIKNSSDVKIVAVEGYTDEDGSTAHNDSLAARRVNTVLSYLRGKIAIRDDFRTRSYGERHKHSAVKAENRKVTIYYIEAKDLARENEILGIPEPQVVKRVITYPRRITVDNPDGTKSTFELNIDFMHEVADAKVGDKLKLADMHFVLNTFAIVKESRPTLYELLIVMQRNPTLAIEIEGHLCCNPVDRQNLSTQRAKAIHNFLLSHGIEKHRLSFKGFGSSQPVYPLPEKNEAERAANRRVEIKIVSR